MPYDYQHRSSLQSNSKYIHLYNGKIEVTKRQTSHIRPITEIPHDFMCFLLPWQQQVNSDGAKLCVYEKKKKSISFTLNTDDGFIKDLGILSLFL